MITRDFNAHLGTLGGVKVVPTNKGSSFTKYWYGASYMLLSSLSEGPHYTYWNSTTRTTINYTIASQDASGYIQRCFTRNPASLNNSDNLFLPISTVICVPSVTTTSLEPSVCQKINWEKVPGSNRLIDYQQ